MVLSARRFARVRLKIFALCLFLVLTFVLISRLSVEVVIETFPFRSAECLNITGQLDETRHTQYIELGEWSRQTVKEKERIWTSATIQGNYSLIPKLVSDGQRDLFLDFWASYRPACRIYTVGIESEFAEEAAVWSHYPHCEFVVLDSAFDSNGQQLNKDDWKENQWTANLLLVNIDGWKLKHFASIIHDRERFPSLCQINVQIRNPPLVNGEQMDVMDILTGFLTDGSYSVFQLEQQSRLLRVFLFNSANSKCVRTFIC
ncbi:hypothetical protein M3Y95_01131900 [Aphelenchoides besseyi]|nr:hypothetical protein M3Y95_01131900 [Aphelenchoides besseyi]